MSFFALLLALVTCTPSNPTIYLSYEVYNNQTMYYTPTKWGSASQSINTAMSTGISQCWVMTTQCSPVQCMWTNFNTDGSTSYTDLQLSGSFSYMTGMVSGKYSTDKACFTLNTAECVNPFNFLAVTSASNMPSIKYSATCGLGPIQDGLAANQQLIPSLKAQNVITN